MQIFHFSGIGENIPWVSLVNSTLLSCYQLLAAICNLCSFVFKSLVIYSTSYMADEGIQFLKEIKF